MKHILRHKTLSTSARGPYALIGPGLLLTLIFFPIVFFVPLLTTKFWFYSRNDIALFRGAYDLYHVDKFLFIIVFVFGMLIPAVKMIASVLCWYFFQVSSVKRHCEILGHLAKLAMLDIMLLAIFVIAFKGVGIGTVEVKYGLYIYTVFIVASLFLSQAMSKAARKFCPKQKRS